jgi:methylmalonyl-CoA mutase cobalamin-binding subunit
VFKGLTLTDAAEVKFNAGGWDVNRGGVFTAVGEAIEAVQDAANLAVPAGTYDVYLSKDASVAYFMTPGESPAMPDTPAHTWYLVGSFNGWATGDPAYKMTYEAGWHVFKGFTLEADAEVKLNAGGWDVNRGGVFAAAGEAIEAIPDAANINVPAGTYDVYLNKAEDTLFFMEAGQTPAL